MRLVILLVVLAALAVGCTTCVPREGQIVGKEHKPGYPTVSVGIGFDGNVTTKIGYVPDRWWLDVHWIEGDTQRIRVTEKTWTPLNVGDRWEVTCGS